MRVYVCMRVRVCVCACMAVWPFGIEGLGTGVDDRSILVSCVRTSTGVVTCMRVRARVSVCVYACMRVCACACELVHYHGFVPNRGRTFHWAGHVYARACVRACVRACLCVCMRVCVYVCMCVGTRVSPSTTKGS